MPAPESTKPIHHETELKLLIQDADVERLQQHRQLADHACQLPTTQQLRSIYYDTADLRIRGAAASLRLRQTPDGMVQTFKVEQPAAAGLHSRAEWEMPVPGPALDLPALGAMIRADGAGQAHWWHLLQALEQDPTLQPLFETRVWRQVWALEFPDGGQIELALDRGSIHQAKTNRLSMAGLRGGASARANPNEHLEPNVHSGAGAVISEVELELKHGDSALLYAFAGELLKSVPLRLGSRSKSSRGYALCSGVGAGPQVVRAAALKLPSGTTVGAGFRALMQNCVAHVDGNALGVASTSDPEFVHQMRVGLRRLAGALRLFRDVLPLPRQLQQDLCWLGATLADARDWEVFAGSTLPAIAALTPAGKAPAVLRKAVVAVATRKRRAAAAAVCSSRYTGLLLGLSGWVLDCTSSIATTTVGTVGTVGTALVSILEQPLAYHADVHLEALCRRLRKRGKGLAEADAPARHRLRIAAKRVRYAVEFFGDLYRPRRVRAFTKALAALQEQLGDMNDHVVAVRLLADLLAAQPKLTAAAAAISAAVATPGARHRRQMRKTWRQVKSITLPWHAGPD
jgi:triphosphatase